MKTAWGAYQFDEVCLAIGRYAERNLNAGKEAFAGFGNQETQRGYRSLKAMAKKKVKIKADGTW